MDETIKAPSGFRFNPFEEELISFYLKPKVQGQKLPCNVVEDRQLYGPNANPWQVFHPENHSWILSEVSPGRFEKVTYVFVSLTKQAAVERNKKAGRDYYIKKAGCGTWGGKTGRNEIRDRHNGDLIGEKRLLVFEINEHSDQDLSKVGYWKMHEFHLHGVNENISNPNNIVLCKITFDSSKKPFVKFNPKINDDHHVKSSSKPQEKDTNVESVASPPTMNNVIVYSNHQGVSENYPKPSEQPYISSLNPVSSDFSWPAAAAYSNDLKKIKTEEQSVEDTTTTTTTTQQLGKRKLEVETSCSTKKLKKVSSDFCWPVKHDIKKEAGGREDLVSGMTTKVQFSSFTKPKAEESVEDTDLGTRNLKLQTTLMTKKSSCPLILIIID